MATGNGINGSTTYTEVEGTIVRETGAAILFRTYDPTMDDETDHWFPLSQISSIHRDPRGDGVDKLHVATWILAKKGLV